MGNAFAAAITEIYDLVTGINRRRREAMQARLEIFVYQNFHHLSHLKKDELVSELLTTLRRWEDA